MFPQPFGQVGQVGQMPYQPTYPYMPYFNPQYYISVVRPLVRYGLNEAQSTGVRHAMTEVALIAYLMGMGYNINVARRIVESWEVDERFMEEY